MLSLTQKVEASKGDVINVNVKMSQGSIDPIDPKDASVELGIDNHAKVDAASGVPLQNAVFPSASEAKIQNYVAKRVNDYVLWGNQRVQFCDSVMNKSLINTQVVLNLKNAANSFQSSYLKTWVIQYSTDLYNCKKDCDAANKALEDFKQKNNLSVQPYKLSPTKKIWSTVLLLALILIETAINAGLFAKGLEQGNLGGIATAFVAAVANVMMSWYLFAQVFRGLLIRCPVSSKYFKIGLLVTFVWLVLEFLFSFGVAHYRDALEAYANAGFEGLSPAMAAAENYFTPLKDLLSWALWLITVAFGSIAYIDGIHMKEPFPGYEQKYNQAQDLSAEYSSLSQEAFDDLKKVKEKTVNEIANEITNIETNYQAFFNAVQDKKSAETQFLNAWHTSITAYTSMITQYQQSNIQYRSPKDRSLIPSYFSKEVDINVSGIWKQTMPSFDDIADQKRLTEQTNLKNVVIKELGDLIDLVHNASDKTMSPFIQNYSGNS